MPQTTDAPDLSRQFLEFIQQQARELRAEERLPETIDEWNEQNRRLRRQLERAWGGFPSEPCPLEPRILGTLQRDGFRIEKLLLQTRDGITMTANAYVPDSPGKHPAVLCVHGHWRLAKSEPTVHSRCLGLVKLGFFVLMADAFGAGERGLGPALGEYHGEMVAATLYPSNRPLSGLLVYENSRAVDYLQSRPEVDAERIGVTGASGGGNQTMYAGAFDERLKCVVPVCSVGNYQAYLGAACCLGEVVPGALRFTEEWGLLALVAPRALMVINATRDAFQFSVGEAEKSVAKARDVFRLTGVDQNLRHAVFESPHDYNKAMREAMYGWMTLHLKGEGDGSPVPEPKFDIEEAETLRCFPGDSRPAEFVTLPQFAATEARELFATRPIPRHLEHWETEEMRMRESLPRVLGGVPRRGPIEPPPIIKPAADGADESIEFQPERGITVFATRRRTSHAERRGVALLLNLDTGRAEIGSDIASRLLATGWDVVTADLRATGATAYPRDQVGRAPDHNTAEWSLWIGRPLLGQWVTDVVRLLDLLDEAADRNNEETAIIGVGTASLVAVCTAALDGRIDRIVTVNGLASFISDVPYENQRLALMVPGILNTIGDVAHLNALCASRRLVIAGRVNGAGAPVPVDDQTTQHLWTVAAYRYEQEEKQLILLPDGDPSAMITALNR